MLNFETDDETDADSMIFSRQTSRDDFLDFDDDDNDDVGRNSNRGVARGKKAQRRSRYNTFWEKFLFLKARIRHHLPSMV